MKRSLKQWLILVSICAGLPLGAMAAEPMESIGTAVDDDQTLDLRAKKTGVTAALPIPVDYDAFFVTPLGKPGDPGKYKYTGPIVGGRDPAKVDWSAFGARSAEEKRHMMVDYAQGRLKVGRAFGGIDIVSDRPSTPAPLPVPATKPTPTPSTTNPPTSDENGEQAWCNTIQNPHIAPKSQYRNDVNGAIDRVIAAGTGLEGPGSNKIVDYDTYHNAVVADLRGRGFRVLYDGEELAICKPGDGFSEQFDISTSTMFVRRFYAAHIRPAVAGLRDDAPAPASEGQAGQPSGAPAAGSPTAGQSPIIQDVPGQQALCNTIQNPNIAPKSKYRNAVMKAIDTVIGAGTGLKEPGSNEIADYDTYHAAVVNELRNAGFCAAHDGEELGVKRPGDDFNEQFDISTASGLVRRFYAAWISPPSIGE